MAFPRRSPLDMDIANQQKPDDMVIPNSNVELRPASHAVAFVDWHRADLLRVETEQYKFKQYKFS